MDHFSSRFLWDQIQRGLDRDHPQTPQVGDDVPNCQQEAPDRGKHHDQFPWKPDERWTKNERYKKHVIRVVHYYLWYGIMGKFQDVLHSNKNKPKKGARPPEPSQPPGEGRQQEKSQRETTPGYKRHAEIMDQPD